MKLRKFLKAGGFITLMLLFMISPSSVYADVGPKPSITVNAVNMPDMPCYMDLLVNYPAEEVYDNIGDESKYDIMMLDILKAYNVDGWRPAMVTGTMPPMFGEIRCEVINGISKNTFSYLGIPDNFKIVVVSSDGKTVVSGEIHRKAFSSIVDFDYSAASAAEAPVAGHAALRLLITLLATLIIEWIFLRVFRFSLKQNWRPFLLINVSTQIILTTSVYIVAYTKGLYQAMLFYFGMEFIIFITEAILFSVFLKQHSKKRRVAFALFANVFSFFAGLIALYPF